KKAVEEEPWKAITNDAEARRLNHGAVLSAYIPVSL
ncbi:hypothetical protein SS7213T_02748, partial [Staphylococcus simiae CCM 7213 = CCUG 51256]